MQQTVAKPERERRRRTAIRRRAPINITSVPDRDRSRLDDRQLDALLTRLDRLCDEMHTLNRRLDRADELQRIVRELSLLNESLQALAYAALGAQPPRVRRRAG